MEKRSRNTLIIIIIIIIAIFHSAVIFLPPKTIINSGRSMLTVVFMSALRD